MVEQPFAAEPVPPEPQLSAMDQELLDLFHELPINKQYEYIGDIKGFLRAVEDSKKYVDEGKRLSG